MLSIEGGSWSLPAMVLSPGGPGRLCLSQGEGAEKGRQNGGKAEVGTEAETERHGEESPCS